jgi:hypothetical protein
VGEEVGSSVAFGLDLTGVVSILGGLMVGTGMGLFSGTAGIVGAGTGKEQAAIKSITRNK